MLITSLVLGLLRGYLLMFIYLYISLCVCVTARAKPHRLAPTHTALVQQVMSHSPALASPTQSSGVTVKSYPHRSDNWEVGPTQGRQRVSCPSVHQTDEWFVDGACGLVTGLVAGRRL